jgi:hypothetical protein
MGYVTRRHAVSAITLLCGLSIAADAQNVYSNQALSRGINYTVGTNQTNIGNGVALADLNNDGHLDVIVTGANSGVVGVYQNNGTGQFTNRTSLTGIPTTTMISSVTAADYDADGDLDLHLTRSGFTDRLYRNDGNFAFTDVSAAAGLDNPGWGMGATWADFDGDGWIDVYVSNRTGTISNFVENALYRNNGDGTFTDVAAALGVIALDDPTLLALWFDMDNDSDPDLYLGTDKGSGDILFNRLYRNDGGTFTDITFAAGMEAYIDCMGFAVGDLSGNGYQDIYMTNIPEGNMLMLNNGDETFTDHAAAAGVEVFLTGWGTAFFDYDNDTDLDLFVVNEFASNFLFRNNGSFPFTDMSPTSGLAEVATTYCFAYGDVDNDGDLDLLVANVGQPVRLFINTQGQDNRWIKLDVVGRGNNTEAIGAVVRLTANNITQMREVFGGGNYKSQNQTVLHFGLGAFTLATQMIEVRWPNSNVRRTLTGYPSNQTWTIYPPARLGDSNNNGIIELAEVQDAISAMQHLAGAELEPGMEIYDMTGDCRITLHDIIAMLKKVNPATGPSAPAAPQP